MYTPAPAAGLLWFLGECQADPENIAAQYRAIT